MRPNGKEELYETLPQAPKDVLTLLPLLLLAAALLRFAVFPDAPAISLDEIPEYAGTPYVELDGNLPSFSQEELTADSYETYSPLDALGRSGPAMASVGQDLMPTEERGAIGQVKPSGWQIAKYDCVDGKYLFNRCHLLGYQLTGENANRENLITGTRYLNVEGMLPFENQVADYVRSTGGHVLYRVSPIFQGTELVAGRGDGGAVRGGRRQRRALPRLCLQRSARGGHRLRHRAKPFGGCGRKPGGDRLFLRAQYQDPQIPRSRLLRRRRHP